MEHFPVLLKEVVEYLNIKVDGCYVDGTVGGGGHAEAILKIMSKNGVYVAIDRDREILEKTTQRLKKFSSKVFFVSNVFSEIPAVLEKLNIDSVDGIVLDLGVSSFQLEDPTRGFSFLREGMLDMRMSPSEGQTAADLVNECSEEELKKIFREWGEERFAAKIARSIVSQREKKIFSTTKELAECVAKTIPPFRKTKIHPATRVFQALRIEVNQELRHLEKFLNLDFRFLKSKGRIAIISFHSLEDRLVKWAFRSWNGFKILTKKPVIPTEEEQKINPRSRSAKLRVVEKE